MFGNSVLIIKLIIILTLFKLINFHQLFFSLTKSFKISLELLCTQLLTRIIITTDWHFEHPLQPNIYSQTKYLLKETRTYPYINHIHVSMMKIHLYIKNYALIELRNMRWLIYFMVIVLVKTTRRAIVSAVRNVFSLSLSALTISLNFEETWMQREDE